MTPDDGGSGLGALIAALILSVASLALVLWFVAVSRGSHADFAATTSDVPEADADTASPTRSPS